MRFSNALTTLTMISLTTFTSTGSLFRQIPLLSLLIVKVNGFTTSFIGRIDSNVDISRSCPWKVGSCKSFGRSSNTPWLQSISMVSEDKGDNDDWFNDYDEFVTKDKGSSNTFGYNDNKQSQFDNDRSFYNGGGDGRRGGRYNQERQGGGRRSFGGGGGGHDYMRHPEDNDTGVDVKMVNDMLSERLECRKTGNFDRADELRDKLRDDLGVYVWDKERTWTTNPNNPRNGGGRGGGGGGRGGRFSQGGRGRNGSRFSQPPRPPRPPRDFGPTGHDYIQTGDGIDSSICTLSEDEIHQLLAQRLQHKMSRKFHKADEIQFQLESSGVTVHDGAKQWRADGIPFDMAKAGPMRSNGRGGDMSPYTFRQRRGEDVSLDEKAIDEISQQVELRAQAKRNRDYQSADDIKDYLQSRYNVTIDDRNKIWYVRSETYVMSPQSEESPNIEIIQDLVNQRWEAKKSQDYDLADNIRDQLKSEYGVTIDDRMKEFTYTPPEQRKRPEILDPWTETTEASSDDGPNEDEELFAKMDEILDDVTEGGESISEEEESQVNDDEEEEEDVTNKNYEEQDESLSQLTSLDELTIPQLKEKLKEAGLPVSGNKGVLIERLSSSLSP